MRWSPRLARRAAAGLGLLAIGYAGAVAALARRHPAPPFDASACTGRVPRFPDGFLWGTATSAHQIDGGFGLNDWSAFEEAAGRIRNGDRSGVATGHDTRVDVDIALMKQLGVNAYRMSIEWARVEPEEGRWDEGAWARVVRELDALRAAGIQPMVTLLHFTLPRWLSARGGLLAPAFHERFARFAGEVATRTADRVELYCTVNEPNVQMLSGYVDGNWPPGERSPELAVQAFAALLRAHARAATELRRRAPRAQIGVAQHLGYFAPKWRASLLDWIAVDQVERAFDWAFYDAILAGRIRLQMPGFPSIDEPYDELRGSADYVGINYYTRTILHFSPAAPAMVERTSGPGPKSDLGWEVYPEGLYALLVAAHERYGLPIYVTENGIADHRGEPRASFVRAHAHAVARAIQAGVPVRGYFHWSLLDNFEWAEGFEPRFGLFHVDYATLARSETPGATDFARVIQEGSR